MANTNINLIAITDKAIIEQIGKFIQSSRIDQNKTQTQIAERAGINRWTISKIENGESITLLYFIKILRALNLLYTLDNYTISEQISPIALAKLERKKRKRASKERRNIK